MANRDDLHNEVARLELQLAQARIIATEYLAILHKREEELDKARALLEAFATWEPVVSSESQKVICACCAGTDQDEQGMQLKAVQHAPSCPWLLARAFLGKEDTGASNHPISRFPDQRVEPPPSQGSSRA